MIQVKVQPGEDLNKMFDALKKGGYNGKVAVVMQFGDKPEAAAQANGQAELPLPVPSDRYPKGHKYRDGKRDKGIKARDLLLVYLRTQPNGSASTEELAREFDKWGFAANALSAAVSLEKTAGRVGCDGSRVWFIKE